MVLNILLYWPAGKVPVLNASVPGQEWKLPPPRALILCEEVERLSSTGDGRLDKVVNVALQSPSNYITDNEKHILKVILAGWLQSLDRNTDEGRKHWAAGFPVLCNGLLVKIKTQRTDRGLSIEKGGTEYTGTLDSWNVSKFEMGTCTFKELMGETVSFDTHELILDINFIQVVQRPGWWASYPALKQMDSPKEILHDRPPAFSIISQ